MSENVLSTKDLKNVLVSIIDRLTGGDWKFWFREIKKFLEQNPSREYLIARLKDAAYLDTSFEGKETHSLTMRPLSKEEAFAEYRTSGGKTWVWDEMENNMPYSTPKAETLDVMIMNFNKGIKSDEALAEMDNLSVRPLTYEELIQYGIAHPSRQEQKWLIGLGTKHTLGGRPLAPVLGFDGGVRDLDAVRWGGEWGDGYRFPVVRK